jgi:DNA-binding SARP family transcriptional activator
MELRILGPVEVRANGNVATLNGAKERTVLATLLLARGRVLSDATITTRLWGCSPPATASAQIYTYVSRLRKYLGPDVQIIRQQPGYVIRTGAALFDYAEFERLAKLGHGELKAGQYKEAARHLGEALALWRGRALANVTDFLADAHLPQLEEASMAVLEGRIEADLEIGRHAQLVPELTGIVAEYPLRERLRAQLMTALYRCDRQADAIAAFHEGRRILAEELGVDPGSTLRTTYQGILTGDLAKARVPRVAVAAAEGSS